jgi:hypothetical protein
MTKINDQDDFDAYHGDTLSEDALKTREVTEGGIAGAVGGAIIGGLAGGPAGAVLGGVAGGALTATVVAGIDHRQEKTIVSAPTPNYTDAGVIPPDGYVSDVDYQRHFASRYAGIDEDYGRHLHAYRYGATLSGVPEYHNHDWDTVEIWAKEDWKTKSNQDWDNVKDAIRYGWERGRKDQPKD